MNNLLHRSLRFCVILLFFIGVFLKISPPQAYAIDNSDGQFEYCDITINETKLSDSGTTDVYPFIEDGQKKYTVKVCDEKAFTTAKPSQQGSPEECLQGGQNLIISIGKWNSRSTVNLTRSVDGCYTGIYVMEQTETFAGNVVEIELDDQEGICDKNMPVCRRISANLNHGVSKENVRVCQDLIDSFNSCSFLNFDKEQYFQGDQVTISGTIPAINTAECKGTYLKDPQLGVYYTSNGAINNVVPPSIIFPFGQSFEYSFSLGSLGVHQLQIKSDDKISGQLIDIDNLSLDCSQDIRACGKDNADKCISLPEQNPGGGSSEALTTFKLCDQIADDVQREKCNACGGNTIDSAEDPKGVWTAIGCIERDPVSIVQSVIKIGIGIGGGITILIILAGAFLITTAGNDPKQVETAKEMITSAIVGLLFIIFSVTILQFIGFTIFQIPGFGRP